MMKKMMLIIAVILIFVFSVLSVNATTRSAEHDPGRADSAVIHSSVKVNEDRSRLDGEDQDMLLTRADTAQNTLEDGEVVEDGINTYVATIWIISISAVCFIAIMIGCIILAKRNQS